MTIDITIRYNDQPIYPQTWYTNHDGRTVFVTTVYPPITPEQRREIDEIHNPHIVESTIEPAEVEP